MERILGMRGVKRVERRREGKMSRERRVRKKGLGFRKKVLWV